MVDDRLDPGLAERVDEFEEMRVAMREASGSSEGECHVRCSFVDLPVQVMAERLPIRGKHVPQQDVKVRTV